MMMMMFAFVLILFDFLFFYNSEALALHFPSWSESGVDLEEHLLQMIDHELDSFV